MSRQDGGIACSLFLSDVDSIYSPMIISREDCGCGWERLPAMLSLLDLVCVLSLVRHLLRDDALLLFTLYNLGCELDVSMKLVFSNH